MRILGKGKTAQAIQDKYPDTIMYDDSDLNSFDHNSEELTIVSPGIPPHNKFVKATKNLISEYDLFASQMPYSIWISGTNGKTTTTQMCQHLLEGYDSICGGNIGTPLAHMDQSKPIWILETSSFTLHYTNIAKPNIYILLPISEDHISWHGSFSEYEQSKLKPLDKLQEGEIAIIPNKYKDYPSNGFKICYENINDLERVFDIDSKKIHFDHPYLIDAVLALAVTKILYDVVDYQKINSFQQDEHKLEKVFDKQNRLWINDSKATNADATIAALENYKDKKIYLVIGGDDKDANLEPMFKFFQTLNIELFAIGANIEKVQVLSNKYDIMLHLNNTIENAVISISQKYSQNSDEIAILSPAAASLDQFNSYAHRGNIYKEFIKNIF